MSLFMSNILCYRQIHGSYMFEVKLLHRYLGRGGGVVITSGPKPRDPEFESSRCPIEALAISFIPRCHSSLSVCLHTDGGGQLNKQSSCSNCSVSECFPEKSR